MPDRLDDQAWVLELRTAVERAGRVLDGTSYGLVKRLRDKIRSEPSRQLAALRALIPEYGRPEFLAPLYPAGNLAYPPAEVLADYRQAVEEDSDFVSWFCESAAPSGRTILLPARWLCHLAGFRHATVQLFIQHPTLPDQLLVQVRGLSRPEAPGNFDSPVAGHVPGFRAAAEVILQELGEEIGLTPENIEDLRQVASYDYGEPPAATGICNREYRTVFAARLAQDAWPRLRFPDAEVAAICIFAVNELATLIERYPERIASGLRASFPLVYPALAAQANGG
jgi:isopentenyldiphosphate isomerase